MTVDEQWSVRPVETALAALGGLVLLALGLVIAGDPAGRGFGVVAGLGLLGLAGSDLLWRPRLAVDDDGLWIRTPGRTARVLWADGVAVKLDERRRLGVTARTLEIDAGELFVLLGRRSLGVDPREVADAISARR